MSEFRRVPFTILLIGAFIAATAWNLSLQSIANPDEPRYAAPAREMIRGGDWLVPQFNHQPRLLKPIFFYWLIAATGMAGKALGMSLAAAMRLGPLLMGLLATLGTYILASRLFDSRTGFIAAFMLLTTRLFHELSRELVVDMTLTAFLLWSWAFFHIALKRIESDSPRFFPLLGFYVCLGLACLTKGPPLVALFVVAPLIVYLLWTGKLKLLKKAGLWWGVPLALLIGCWWIVVLQQKGFDILAVYKTENFTRAAGGKDHQQKLPFVYYIANLGESFLPWVVLMPFALIWTVRAFKKSRQDGAASPEAELSDSSKLLACALGIPFVILGIIISKRHLYLLPLYPLISIWLAQAIRQAFLKREGEPVRGTLILRLVSVAVIATGVWISLRRPWPEIQENRLQLAILGISVAAAFGLLRAAASFAAGQRYRGCLNILAVAWALTIGYEAIYRPVRENMKMSESFYRDLSKALAGRAVVFLGESPNEAIWYLDRGRDEGKIDFVRRPQLKEKFFEASGTVLLAKDRELQHPPELEKSVRPFEEAPEPLRRGADSFVLVVPDPDHPPNAAVFKGVRHEEDADSGE